MARRTYERDGIGVEHAEDLGERVKDKRESWRANSAKARRRQRRYSKRLTAALAMDRTPDDSMENP